MNYSTSNVLVRKNINNEKLLFLYGKDQSQGEISFSVSSSAELVSSDVKIEKNEDGQWDFSYTYGKPQFIKFLDNGKKITIVVTNRHLAGRTWFLNHKGRDFLLIGPDFIPELIEDADKMRIHFENEKNEFEFYTYGLEGETVEGEQIAPLTKQVSSGMGTFSTEPKSLKIPIKSPFISLRSRNWVAKHQVLPIALGLNGEGNLYRWRAWVFTRDAFDIKPRSNYAERY